MRSVALIPACALLAGAAVGVSAPAAIAGAAAVLPVLCGLATVLWRLRATGAVTTTLAVAFALAGFTAASHSVETSLRPPLRDVLDARIGGFAIQTLGPERDHDPVTTRARLIEDAAVRDGYVSMRASVESLAFSGGWISAGGVVSLSVSGDAAPALAGGWRRGRTIVAPIAFRRPARYLNDGVPDVERDLLLDGDALFGSIKSGLLVDVQAGHLIAETAGRIRAHVRRRVERWIARHDPVAAAVVTAVLIGDRTGLPPAIRDRLQAAGTYHVIAISGGNIAILAGLVIGVLMLVGVRGRPAAVVAILVLLAYAEVVASGPSVWRATLMAGFYFGARALDHRTMPWQAAACAAALMVAVRPLDVRDPGFILTFGATAALLEAARLAGAAMPRSRAAAWVLGSLIATVAIEAALLPVSAQSFSRVTGAGIPLNLVAVPLMGLAQLAGIVVAVSPVEDVAGAAGWIAFHAADGLIESSRLLDAAPWLARRVPPPGAALVAFYYLALALTLVTRTRARVRCGAAWLCAALMVAGVRPPARAAIAPGVLRLDVFDVGQAEAMLLSLDRHTLLVDAGGVPFGAGPFDVGARVLLPALWSRGLRSVGTLLMTHGDPDHVGGVPVLLDTFRPSRVWEGIAVPGHQPTEALRTQAATLGTPVEARRAGESFPWGRARIRVLHPPEPDWERRRIRNDDSVVLEVVYGEVALLLTGDVSADVEREVVPRLTPSRVRILKVAHHGSRTSTSRELLDAWRPQYAVISAGRGNTFGHPTPEVIDRLTSIGATVLRTDLHGQVTFETDGRSISVRTFGGWPLGGSH